MSRNVNDPSISNVFRNVTNTVTNLVLGAVAFCAITFAITFPGSFHLKQHIYLCVIGYVLIIAQAILGFNPHTGWSLSLRLEDKRTAHFIMTVAGAILAITGSIIRMVNVNNNFQSVHGVFGLIAMIMTVISVLGGLVNYYAKKTRFNKIMHSCAGISAITLAFICLCLGFNQSIYRNTMGNISANTLICLTLVGLLGTILSASISNFNRIFNR